ncbi:MAG: aconitase family protein, partial [Thermoplasmata archaeon]|nr:aconitase family protein [Thermoplasmata archaeon]
METTPAVAAELNVRGVRYRIAALDRIPGLTPDQLARCPITRKILAENVLRHATPGYDSVRIARALITGVSEGPAGEIPFRPERILLQDFTGVPVLVDLTGLRTAARLAGLDPERVNPTVPVDLVVDHSVQVDSFGSARSIGINLDREYERNSERYRLLRWAQGEFRHMRIVPPGNGICHQVNLEYLSTVVTEGQGPEGPELYPDTLLGTDSHTTMVNGAGVLGWGVGGIEAEAAMLGEPYFVSEPRVVGVRFLGQLPEGSTATDLVLTVTRLLRDHGVVDKFVEFYGPGLSTLSVPDRATISNMCPEYGATSALFPLDESTLRYLTASGRSEAHVARVEAYARRQGLWHESGSPEARYDERVELDLST